MKRLNTLILSVLGQILLVLAVTGCGSQESPNLTNTGDDIGVIVANNGEVEPPPPPAPKTYAFHDAAQRGLIGYQVTGNGSSSGEALTVKVWRLTSEPIRLHVEPGTVFTTGSAGVQSMVARSFARELAEALTEAAAEEALEKSGLVDLLDDKARSFVLEAYCRNFELENPSEQDRFSASSVDPRAASILEAARAQGLRVTATQAAIWMDDGVAPAKISEKFPATGEDLAAAAQLLAQLPPRP